MYRGSLGVSQGEARARRLVDDSKYWILIARTSPEKKAAGFITLYESYALYAEGAYGTIPELYVRPQWRSHGIGQQLLGNATEFAVTRKWRRLEVTTPPLPQFDRTLDFYLNNNFEITGGRKLKMDIRP